MPSKIHPAEEDGKDTISPAGIYAEATLSEEDRHIIASLPSASSRHSLQGTALYRRHLNAARASKRRSMALLADPEMGAAAKRRNTIFMLEKAEMKGLKTDYDADGQYDNLDRLKQLDVIRQMPIPLHRKRQLREKVFAEMPELNGGGCDAFLYRQKTKYYRWKVRAAIKWQEFTAFLTLWNGAFKVIEGFFGSGVLSYFRLLKTLFQLNIGIFLLILCFVVIPQAAFPSQDYSAGITGANSTNAVNLSLYCSALYEGWMEQTPMFYGDYADREVQVRGTDFKYNMPLAYLLTTAGYYLISLLVMVRTATAIIRMRQFASGDSMKQNCNKVFAGWDYSMSDPHNCRVKHKSIYRDMQGTIEEERNMLRRQNMTVLEKCRVLLIRIPINLFVLCLLGGAGYLIYFTTVETAEIEDSSGYKGYHPMVQLLVEYMTSLTITALNAILPLVFEKLAQFEGYTPAFEVNITLLRTVFLKLASLAMLMITLFSTITCKPKDVCNVGTSDCVSLRCWETKIGQELYKLVIIDFLAIVLVTFFVEFPRKLVVTKCNAKIFKLIGEQEFDIPKNVLDLIYQQVLLWLGAFFAPLLSAVTVLKAFIIFYIKMMSVMFNCQPSAKPYRESSSAAFFMAILIVTYILCGVPIFYIVWYVTPSRGCGPFRVHGKMYDVVPNTVDEWPGWLQDILDFAASSAMLIPAFIALALIIYYFRRLISGYKQMVRLLKDQLSLEGRDKQFLLRRIQELQAGTQQEKTGLIREESREEEKREDTPPHVPLDQV